MDPYDNGKLNPYNSTPSDYDGNQSFRFEEGKKQALKEKEEFWKNFSEPPSILPKGEYQPITKEGIPYLIGIVFIIGAGILSYRGFIYTTVRLTIAFIAFGGLWLFKRRYYSGFVNYLPYFKRPARGSHSGQTSAGHRHW